MLISVISHFEIFFSSEIFLRWFNSVYIWLELYFSAAFSGLNLKPPPFRMIWSSSRISVIKISLHWILLKLQNFQKCSLSTVVSFIKFYDDFEIEFLISTSNLGNKYIWLLILFFFKFSECFTCTLNNRYKHFALNYVVKSWYRVSQVFFFFCS